MMRSENSQSLENNHSSAVSFGESFLEFIADNAFPCVGAKSALSHDAIDTHEFNELGEQDNDLLITDELSQFVEMIESQDGDSPIVHSFVAIFDGPFDMNEQQFESALWSQLWRLHKLDIDASNLPANDVSNDTNSPNFSLSIAGHPFFIIGLHPHASRMARRFSHPVMVFNSHRQFDKLKDDGRYEKMQAATRSRDVDLQGSINPNLADFGQASEARQYSGRKVGKEWKCPYDFRRKDD